MGSVGADIVVRGYVQGVGFRYFCQSRATRLQLTGWVRNLPDSSVELMVEGDRGGIETLIEELKVGPRSASVADVRVQWKPFTGKYHSFSITG
jgi:acylphosphatase